VNSPQVFGACEVAQVRVPAFDGYELGGLLCSVRGERPARVAVLHPGAGIRALNYRRFATFLAQSGMPVLLYDYRGIGLSRPRALRGFRASWIGLLVAGEFMGWVGFCCGSRGEWGGVPKISHV